MSESMPGRPQTVPGGLPAHIVPDELDFDEFFRDEYRSVVGLAYVLCGDRFHAEDLAQEAFAAALRQWFKVVDYDDPGAWVRRMVANRSISRIRRLTNEAATIARLRRRRVPLAELPDADHELWAAVRELPRRQTQTVALVYLEGRTVAQAADILGIGAETAKTHLTRARRRLAIQLGEPTEETSP